MLPFALRRGPAFGPSSSVLRPVVATGHCNYPRSHSGCASSNRDATQAQKETSDGHHHSTTPRVRYAPSPTGSLHLGGLRTALFNYLFARAHGGAFLLRIEDTDKQRQKPGSIDGLIRALQWCGLDYDEGPVRIDGKEDTNAATDAHSEAHSFTSKGSSGPYIQSQRLPVYRQHADALLQSGHAYRCFCTPERLQALRDAQAKAGVPNPVYDRACLKLPAGEAERRAAAGEPHVVRLLVPQQGSSTFDDNVLGVVSFAHNGVDDQVLIKSDGYPTYHLASVVDDHLMNISHVIRGQEWLSSTPKHLILYKSFGWQPPMFAHLPLLLNADRTKLSKRHGDASVEDFMASGYLPEALVNFVAFLGWSPPLPGQTGPTAPAVSGESGKKKKEDASAGASAEVMDLQRMVELFKQSSGALPANTMPKLSRINKANAVVDQARLDFLNGQHIRKLLTSGLVSSSASSPQGHLQVPTALADTPSIKRLREAVMPLLATTYKGFVGSDLPIITDIEHVNALLLLQHERVKQYEDYPSLLMPFMVSARTSNTYATWVKREGDEGKAKMEQKLIGLLAKHNGNSGSAADSASHHEQLLGAFAPGTKSHDALKALVGALAVEHKDVEGAPSLLDKCKKVACEPPHSLPNGLFMTLMRYVMTGSDVGASLSDTMRLLGQEEVLARLKFWLC
jgi:glutamyl/glutaminyl-tRNA synthetase